MNLKRILRDLRNTLSAFCLHCFNWNILQRWRFLYKCVFLENNVPGCTIYLAKTSKTTDIATTISHLTSSEGKHGWRGSSNIEYAANAIQLCLQCPFSPHCIELNIRWQITRQKYKRRLKEDALLSEFDHAHEAKKKPRLSSENRLEWRRHEEVSFHDFCRINMSCNPI